jgi:uncharacterized membrane protein
MTVLSRLSLAVLVILLVTSSSAQTPTACSYPAHYKIIRVPLQLARINNSGLIAGLDEENQPATWKQHHNVQKIVTAPDFRGVRVIGLNDAGDIVGQMSATEAGKIHAFGFIHGSLKVLAGPQSKAKAINNAGQVAIEQSPGGPFLWSDNKLLPLGGCCGGGVSAINEQGQIAGELNDGEAGYSAFVWGPNRGLEIVGPPAVRSSALAINNAGHTLIRAFSPNQIFLRREGRLTAVELSPEFVSQPRALNDCDVIVGEYGPSSDNRAFIWDRKNGFRDLNGLVDKTDGWILESAVDINGRGEIIGTGDHQDESNVGFLLVPKNTK